MKTKLYALALLTFFIIIPNGQPQERLNGEGAFNFLLKVMKTYKVPAEITGYKKDIINNHLKPRSQQQITGHRYSMGIGKVMKKYPKHNTVIYEGKVEVITTINNKVKSFHIKVNNKSIATYHAFYYVVESLNTKNVKYDWKKKLETILKLPETDFKELPVECMKDFHMKVTYLKVSKDNVTINLKPRT